MALLEVQQHSTLSVEVSCAHLSEQTRPWKCLNFVKTFKMMVWLPLTWHLLLLLTPRNTVSANSFKLKREECILIKRKNCHDSYSLLMQHVTFYFIMHLTHICMFDLCKNLWKWSVMKITSVYLIHLYKWTNFSEKWLNPVQCYLHLQVSDLWLSGPTFPLDLCSEFLDVSLKEPCQ